MDATAPAGMLADAVDRKATRYGRLDLPYIVAVFDRTAKLAPHSDDFAETVAGALFGPVLIRDTAMADGTFRRTDRRGFGLWSSSTSRDFNGVSAVLSFPRDDLWHLRDSRWQPLLAINPQAHRPLPAGLLPFNELVVRGLTEDVRRGHNAADILGLPEEWPPQSALE
jgi:hypothetical protein